MLLISDPFFLAIALAAIIASAMAGLFELRDSETNCGGFRLSALVLLLGTTILIWSQAPRLLLVGSMIFAISALHARPQGSTACCVFASSFLVVALALPIAQFVPANWIAIIATAAVFGLAYALGTHRTGHIYAIAGATLWSFVGAGAIYIG